MTFIILHQAGLVNVKIKKPQLPDGVPLQDSCGCIINPLFTLYFEHFPITFLSLHPPASASLPGTPSASSL